MSALVGEWIRRNVLGRDACAALCVPSGFVRSVAFACRAHGRHPFVPSGLAPVAQDIIHRPQCPIRRTVRNLRPTSPRCGPTAAVLVRESAFSRYAACSACVRCQCRNRFQQISANFLATATRAIFAPDRFRTRV